MDKQNNTDIFIRLFNQFNLQLPKEFKITSHLRRGVWEVRIYDNYNNKEVGIYYFDPQKEMWYHLNKRKVKGNLLAFGDPDGKNTS